VSLDLVSTNPQLRFLFSLTPSGVFPKHPQYSEALRPKQNVKNFYEVTLRLSFVDFRCVDLEIIGRVRDTVHCGVFSP